MINKRNRIFIFVFSLFSFSLFSETFPLFAEETDYLQNPEFQRLSALLQGYLANDLELQKVTLTAQSKALDLSSSKIKAGIDVKLSTGNVSISTGGKDQTRITVAPSAVIGISLINDGQIDFSLPYTIEGDSKTVSNGSVSATAGIISGSSRQSKISVMEAERSYTEARRSVRDRALNAEKEFYENLKKLYESAISIQTLKCNLYDDSLDLRVLETQGYSKTSAKYRQLFLKVQSDKRNIQEEQRIFERETAIFAKKCGMELERTTAVGDEKVEKGERDENYDPVKAGENAYNASISFLPEAIPQVKAEDIFSHNQDSYVKIENAGWQKQIAELKRQADVDMTLKATGEYKFNSSVSGYDDAGGKLVFDWKGISASAGAYVPTGINAFSSAQEDSRKNSNPYFQFSLDFSPSQWKLSKLEKQQDEINSKLEDIAIKNARDNYETDVLAKVSTFHDIKWSENSYAEEYDMYNQLESDMEKWLKQGVVTESDWLNARNNKEKARLNIMINCIDLLIFNNEVKLLFYDDMEK